MSRRKRGGKGGGNSTSVIEKVLKHVKWGIQKTSNILHKGSVDVLWNDVKELTGLLVVLGKWMKAKTKFISHFIIVCTANCNPGKI